MEVSKWFEKKSLKISKISYRPVFQNMFPLSETKVNEIADDIKQNGYKDGHPIHVWNVDKNYVVVEGHTRIAAATKAGLKEIPVVVHYFTSEEEALIFAYKEQTQRRNLNEAEMLTTISKLSELVEKEGAKGRTSEKIAERTGLSPRTVAKHLVVAKSASEDDLQAIKENRKSVNEVYNQIQEAKKPESEKNSKPKECKFCTEDGRCMKWTGGESVEA